MEINLAIPAVSLILFDAQNVIAPWRRDNVLQRENEPDMDFTLVVPLFGSPQYFKNSDFLSKYPDNALLAINTHTEEMREFADQMEQSGWRVSKVITSDNPSVVDTVEEALKDVHTTYVIRMDGDSFMEDNPGKAVAAVRKAKADLCSVKVLASNTDNLIETMQAVEYSISMQGRHNAPWLTSGACMIAKTDSLRAILKRHSHWYYSEDMETGRVAKALGMKVRHVNFECYTEVPSTFKSWFNQRRGWWAGNFRTTWINFEHNFRYPVWMFYNVVLIWMLLTAKWTGLLSALMYLPWLILIYTLVTISANWTVKTPWMILMPYYAFFQALVLPTFGAFKYFSVALKTSRWGRFKVRPFGAKYVG